MHILLLWVSVSSNRVLGSGKKNWWMTPPLENRNFLQVSRIWRRSFSTGARAHRRNLNGIMPSALSTEKSRVTRSRNLNRPQLYWTEYCTYSRRKDILNHTALPKKEKRPPKNSSTLHQVHECRWCTTARTKYCTVLYCTVLYYTTTVIRVLEYVLHYTYIHYLRLVT
jgi:hypothetical protein